MSFYQGTGGNTNDRPTLPEGANIVIGTDRRVHTIQCNRCNEWGHYANQFPEINGEVSICLYTKNSHTYNFSNHNKHTRYLLDTGATHSTVNTLNNMSNVKNGSIKDSLHTQINSGYIDFRQKGNLDFVNLEAFYNGSSAANILAFHQLNNFTDTNMYYNGFEEDFLN